jgi:hypothetical protein
MTSQRVCQITPIPSDRAARVAFAQGLNVGSEGVLCCLKLPHQAVMAGVPSASAAELIQNISSSLTTTFWVGPVAAAEAAMEQWAKDCFAALDEGLCPEDEDAAFLGLWQHPSKDLVMLAVLGSGDWAADLEETLSPQGKDLVQLAFSGNDNEPIGFLPDFITDNPDLDPAQVYDIAETVLLTVNEEWLAPTLEGLAQVDEGLVERFSVGAA